MNFEKAKKETMCKLLLLVFLLGLHGGLATEIAFTTYPDSYEMVAQDISDLEQRWDLSTSQRSDLANAACDSAATGDIVTLTLIYKTTNYYYGGEQAGNTLWYPPYTSLDSSNSMLLANATSEVWSCTATLYIPLQGYLNCDDKTWHLEKGGFLVPDVSALDEELYENLIIRTAPP